VATPIPTELPTETWSLSRRTAWGALLAMVFLVPLIMSDFTLPGAASSLAFSSVELVKVSLILVLALVSLSAWAWDLLRNGGQVRHTPVDWLVVAWMVWVVVTTITSVHRPTALLGAQGRYEGLVTFFAYALIYFLTLQFVGQPERVLQLAKVLFWSSSIVAVYGLLQYGGVVSLPKDLPWNEAARAFATYGNPNVLGGFLVIATTVALGLALRERGTGWRLCYWLGFGLNGLALMATFTRGAWIGGLVSIVLLAVMAWRQRIRLRWLDTAPAGLFAAAGVALAIRSLSNSGEVTNFAKRVASIFQFDSGSGLTRTEIWHAASDAIRDRPLFGWGSDTFGFVFSKFKTVDYVYYAGGASGADNAHNYALQLACGLGVVGVTLIACIWIWMLLRSWRTVFGRSGGSDRFLVGAFWAAVGGYLLHLVFGISVPGCTFLLWIALAVLSAPTARQVAVRARKWGAPATTVVVLLAALGIAGQAVALVADRAYVVASEDFSERSLAQRIASGDQAVALDPLVPQYRSAAAALRVERMSKDVTALGGARDRDQDLTSYTQHLAQSFAAAESAYKDAMAFAPNDYANYVNLVSVYNLAGETLDPKYYQQAIETAERGIAVMPLGTHVRVRLTAALVATGQTDQAVLTLKYCNRLDPADGVTALALARLYQPRGQIIEALSILTWADAATPGQPGVAAAIKALAEGKPLP
jgi:O-antigen ligase/tetratricopeptide (TPR) repeat protein